MIKFLLKVFLVCLIITSCSSETDIITESETPINVNLNRQQTGSSAKDLLSASAFKKMIVEVAYIEGFKPTETALNNFKNFINDRTFKPEGVTFVEKSIENTGKTTYTLDEVVEIEKVNRTQYNTNNTIAVWVLFIDGKSSKDTNQGAILGTAYWNTSFVIYQETIQGLSDSTFEPNRSLLESSVIHHEFGHILGLTNLGTDLQSDHEDEEHPKHCIEQDCLMYWAAESSQGIGNMVSGGSLPTLDAQCLADLRANGGK
ncbi:membrane metalloprotease [Polaribacter sp.]|uniref:membrane metalloprotease n=1 Tax=Polaribacter sp. TaxID=1920175 RepID=UPI0035C7B47F